MGQHSGLADLQGPGRPQRKKVNIFVIGEKLIDATAGCQEGSKIARLCPNPPLPRTRGPPPLAPMGGAHSLAYVSDMLGCYAPANGSALPCQGCRKCFCLAV